MNGLVAGSGLSERPTKAKPAVNWSVKSYIQLDGPVRIVSHKTTAAVVTGPCLASSIPFVIMPDLLKRQEV